MKIQKVWSVCKDILLVSLLVFLLAPRFVQSEEVMPLGDVVAKGFQNSGLSNDELQQIRLKFNEIESHDAVTGGWIGPEGQPRFQSMYAEQGEFGQLPATCIRLARDDVQAIPNAAYTEVIYDTTTYEYYQYAAGSRFYNPAVSTTRIYFPQTGVYMFFGDVRFAANATGHREIVIKTNRTDTESASSYIASAGVIATNIAVILPFAGSFKFDIGDWIEFRVWQNTGGNLNIDNARITVCRIK